jgi:hypothetical protein
MLAEDLDLLFGAELAALTVVLFVVAHALFRVRKSILAQPRQKDIPTEAGQRSINGFRGDLYSVVVGSYDGLGHAQFVAADEDGPVSVFEALKSVPSIVASRLPNGNVRVSQTAEIGWTYILQQSSDLSAWINIHTNTATSSEISLEIPQSAAPIQSFYRVMLSPK